MLTDRRWSGADDADEPSAPPCIGRRAILAGAGLTSVAVLAGCSSSADQASSEPGPKGKPVTLSKDRVPVGGGLILPDQQVVVTQPTKGSFHAFSAVCTHAGCLVQDIGDGVIRCPCHGSEFDVTDGSVVSGPATQGLPTISLTMRGSTISIG